MSKFADLRPKECILAMDKHGTHSVCVCMHHQNTKLIFEALKQEHLIDSSMQSYRDMLKKYVCDESTDRCYFNQCNECPGSEWMEELFKQTFEENLIDEVKFKQWIINNGS